MSRSSVETLYKSSDLVSTLADSQSILDIESIRKALPSSLCDRHEKRSMPASYVPNHSISRYSSAIKNLLPCRRTKVPKELIPVDKVGLYSLTTFSWLTPSVLKAYRKGLKPEDVPLCSVSDSAEYGSLRLEYLWKEELDARGPNSSSFFRVCIKSLRTRLAVHLIPYFLSLIIGFIGPIIFMKKLLEFAEDENGVMMYGFIWAGATGLAELMRAACHALTFAIGYKNGIQLRSACMGLLYKKIIKLASFGDKSIGELVNLFANDSQRIYDFAVMSPLVVGGPFVALLGTIYISMALGPFAVLGMLAFLLFYPLQYGLSRATGYLRKRAVGVTDYRVRLMNEILSSVRLIKQYAWEKSFSRKIMEIRAKEKGYLEQSAFVNSVSLAFTPAMPIIAVIVTFLAHIAAGNNLTSSQAMAFAAFMIARLRSSLHLLREGTKAFYEARVSFKRIQSVLLMEEIAPYVGIPLDKNIAVCIQSGYFAWDFSATQEAGPKDCSISDKKELPDLGNTEVQFASGGHPVKRPEVLSDINVFIRKGKLVGVCGGVGSGKSSLMSAVLGHMRLTGGTVSAQGTLSYVAQQAWIMNATLRENILFGEPYDAERYQKAIWCSALSQDLAILPAGDATEIGERGINLSGGQRQRVSIARAVYANKDVYLFDDPLSAVDAHVGQHIFDHCIKTALKGKTVIFATHQLQYLSQCDEVIMMENGRMFNQGTHEELMENTPQYANLINTFLAEQEKEEDNEKEVIEPEDEEEAMREYSIRKRTIGATYSGKIDKNSNAQKEPNKNGASSGKLMSEEKMEEGNIPFSVYHTYIKCAGGYILFIIVLLTFAANVASTAFSSWWLSHWLKQGSGNTTILIDNVTVISTNINDHPDLHFYEMVYGLLIIVILVSNLVRGFLFTKITLRASSKLHNKLFIKIISSPMHYFETTPLGRFLNLFSRDLDEVDARLPTSLEGFLQNIFIIFVSLTFVALVFPWFMIPLVVFVIIFLFMCKIFRLAIRDLKRIENVSRSPIFSHVSATIQGLSTVRAFEKERAFLTKFMVLFDENTSSFFLYNCALRWLGIRLDLVSTAILITTAVLVVMLHGVVHAAFAGLALVYSTQLSSMLQFTVRLFSESESRFTSVQRMAHYIDTFEDEEVINDEKKKPPTEWPIFGSIKFKDVMMRYRSELPLVLKGITFEIRPNEKIGIVGRTGSGKSSLGVCLFRLVEPSSGTITIDGINIANISLADLRSKLSIIPQDPVLFIGTVRFNLDPFEQYPDSALWEALEKTYMKEKIAALPGQLQSEVVENGENFSVGERQLLCMARAILRHSKVLLLDEATAAIDTQTDALVQKTLREAFADCTMLTIAHRLNTVLCCDRVMVLDEGRIREFDQPSALLSNPQSIFSQMMAAAENASKHLTSSSSSL